MAGTGPSEKQAPDAAPVASAPVALAGVPATPDLTGALTPTTVLALQRTAGNLAVGRVLGRGGSDRVIARTDQRVGTGALSSGQIASIEQEIYPRSGPVPGSSTPRLWDGRTGAPNHEAHRRQLRAELLRAMGAYLDRQMPAVNRDRDPRRTPRAPMTTMEGAGRAAKRHVDGVFGAYASAAALTALQAHLHSTFSMSSGAGLIDRSDPSQYGTLLEDLADWIAETAGGATRAMERHHFDKNRSTEEADWLAREVVAEFARRRGPDLDAFDRFGFFDTTRRRISVVPTLSSGGSQHAGPGGAPPEALRRQQFANYQLLVHEYIHSLEHPAFQAARGGNRILFEGMCEHFALQVKRIWVPILQADSNHALRMEIEGADPGGSPWPGFSPAWVDNPDAGDYAPYVEQVRRIIGHIGAGGEAAVRAAFFQGHVELIGLRPAGGMRTAPLQLTDDVHVPNGISTRAALSAASGVPEAEIARDNPALGTTVRFGTPVMLRGCREHVIVQAQPTSDAPAGPAVIETPAQIAAQHGVAEADIRRANPFVNWASLAPGDHVLIPRH